jgi:hypothetical protein
MLAFSVPDSLSVSASPAEPETPLSSPAQPSASIEVNKEMPNKRRKWFMVSSCAECIVEWPLRLHVRLACERASTCGAGQALSIRTLRTGRPST